MPEHPDIIRLRNEYGLRNKVYSGCVAYSNFNTAYHFTWLQRQRALIRGLSKQGISNLDKSRILEVGCGSGKVLTEFLALGARANKLVGIDLLTDRLSDTHERLPGSGIACADGQRIPFASGSFDILLQYTAFTSILDAGVKSHVAREMLRVVKKSGFIIWYDFWLNPTNRQTRGIRPDEIRRLFPGCSYKCYKITLAPPIARRMVGFSWILAELLEKMKVFNSHYLVFIHPNPLT